jgi:hypothetical protein
VSAGYREALEKNVIEPVRLVEKLVASRPYVTRLYTTLSAAEMTVDPLFTFNADQPAVSNTHTAERVVECNPDITQFDAPWRVELPQGGVIRGVGSVWPTAVAPALARCSKTTAPRSAACSRPTTTRCQAVTRARAAAPSRPGARRSARRGSRWR